MHDVQLSASQLTTMRALLRLDPVPGRPLPQEEAFQLLDELVPCDLLGAVFVDLHGNVESAVQVLPSGRQRSTAHLFKAESVDDEDAVGGPFYLGYMHWREHPAKAERCGVPLADDSLAIGFRNGADHMVQYFFQRSGRFSPEEMALLWMLGPALERLARERPTPHLPTCLTLTERRILSHVAAGRTNQEIAAHFFIATSTVRKHLENCYRKLGVTNRLAAIARLQGADRPGLDLRERIDKYA
jgi:DNA-binding CsgD family transcriptional regulator